MNWLDAYKAMKNGNSVRKKDWQPEAFLYINEKTGMIEASELLESEFNDDWFINRMSTGKDLCSLSLQAYEDTVDDDWEVIR